MKRHSPIPAGISVPRKLAIKWVFRLEFDLEVETLSLPTFYRLLNALEEQSKNPMDWRENECQSFVMDLIKDPYSNGWQKLVERYAPTSNGIPPLAYDRHQIIQPK